MTAEPIHLRGMTWRHDRAVAPLEACSRLWQDQHGVRITWEARSLQDFETFPVGELAARYDLLVIDHPHVGIAADAGSLLPLDINRVQASSYVGRSLKSYVWANTLWALPIDAAAQVQAFNPRRLKALLPTYRAALELAPGELAIPLLPPHGLLSLFTLYHQAGAVLGRDGLDPRLGAAAFELLAAMVDRIDPWCHTADPIAALEALADPGATIAASPLIFGYVNYAMPDYRANAVAFADLPVVNGSSVGGSVLGGTGIAVSAACEHRAEAVAFAHWLAGKETQRGPYVIAKGQPAHAEAWDSEIANAAAGQFFKNTRQTLKGAWVRPRHAGFIEFQSQAAEYVNTALIQRRSSEAVIAAVNLMFQRSMAEPVSALQSND
ncbi:multiple sugar transport system substrate-binding protein [Devosia sp. UYZn731]|uniref:extracellular solute-binding protein n=1 Tax=Devosia sp. UYZn731 TaxID=3156345 RepID=UPI003390EAC4